MESVALSIQDSVAGFRLRLATAAMTAPFLYPFFGLGCVAWLASVSATEVVTQILAVRHLKRPRPGFERVFLALALAIASSWAAGPVALLFSPKPGAMPIALVWLMGMFIYGVTNSYRSLPNAAVSIAPAVVGLLLAPVAELRSGWGACALLVLFTLNILVFAYQAIRLGHRRETELVASKAHAHELAFHDQLTGLANRRQFMEAVARALPQAARQEQAVAVLLIDLDRFKFINDTYGHQCGDELIQEVGRRLTAVCRGEDLCARLGGDEFVVLATGCGADEASTLAGRILEALARPVQLSAALVHTAGSIGVSVCGDGLADADELLRQADLALYRVKEHGRGAFCFFEIEMDAAVQKRRGLERDLRQALAAEEVKVVYQPQFHCGQMVAVEALARWRHAERGDIAPTYFVALADESGLAGALGFQVIRRAFADSARWPNLRVVINLYATFLKLPQFLPELQQLIETTGVVPERFEFDLGETVLMSDDLRVHHTLASLRGLGFRLALDDFGTGASSLRYLRAFPVDAIKIDAGFIGDMTHDRVAESVIRAVIRLGRSLGINVVAEGVETAEQRSKLAAMGCRSLQGFATGRPVPADDIQDVVWIEDFGPERELPAARARNSERLLLPLAARNASSAAASGR